MEEIIKEIVKIDSNAMENRKQQENRINERKAYYEAQIAAYEKERIEDAKEMSSINLRKKEPKNKCFLSKISICR